jgi:SAM-dependent methyltransferase
MRSEFPPIGETWKARDRRERTGWFAKYAPPEAPGLDIGPDKDPLNATFRRWLYEVDGDATFLRGVPDRTFQTVYASHVLEHINDVHTALTNWWRVLRPGGHLIVLVPHRDRYEKRTSLPSRWNPDHKWYWLPDRDEAPCTLNFRRVLDSAIPDALVVSFGVLDEGFEDRGPDRHSFGEYSIEAVLKKTLGT